MSTQEQQRVESSQNAQASKFIASIEKKWADMSSDDDKESSEGEDEPQVKERPKPHKPSADLDGAEDEDTQDKRITPFDARKNLKPHPHLKVIKGGIKPSRYEEKKFTLNVVNNPFHCSDDDNSEEDKPTETEAAYQTAGAPQTVKSEAPPADSTQDAKKKTDKKKKKENVDDILSEFLEKTGQNAGGQEGKVNKKKKKKKAAQGEAPESKLEPKEEPIAQPQPEEEEDYEVDPSRIQQLRKQEEGAKKKKDSKLALGSAALKAVEERNAKNKAKKPKN